MLDNSTAAVRGRPRAILVARYPGKKEEGLRNTKTKTKRQAKKTAGRVPKKRSTAGESIIKGLEEAIAWTRAENNNVRVTLAQVPNV